MIITLQVHYSAEYITQSVCLIVSMFIYRITPKLLNCRHFQRASELLQGRIYSNLDVFISTFLIVENFFTETIFTMGPNVSIGEMISVNALCKILQNLHSAPPTEYFLFVC